MKKFFSLLLVSICFLQSCGKQDSANDVVDGITSKLENVSSYKSSCDLEIYDEDKTICWTIEVLYLTPDYYKVSFLNDKSNQLEIIVKNTTGVYALTPSLGKEFRFESEWPLNSSMPYIPNLVIEDIVNDPEKNIKEDGSNVIVKSSINHKVHDEYNYQEVSIKMNSKSIDSVSYYNTDNLLLLKASYSSIVYDVNVSKSDFEIDNIMNLEITSLGEGSVINLEGSLEVSYIYPGSSISESMDSITIYGGDNPYTVIMNDVDASNEPTVSRIYDSFDISNLGMVYYNNTSATLIYMDKEIQVISSALDKKAMLKILNSISII